LRLCKAFDCEIVRLCVCLCVCMCAAFNCCFNLIPTHTHTHHFTLQLLLFYNIYTLIVRRNPFIFHYVIISTSPFLFATFHMTFTLSFPLLLPLSLSLSLYLLMKRHTQTHTPVTVYGNSFCFSC